MKKKDVTLLITGLLVAFQLFLMFTASPITSITTTTVTNENKIDLDDYFGDNKKSSNYFGLNNLPDKQTNETSTVSYEAIYLKYGISILTTLILGFFTYSHFNKQEKYRNATVSTEIQQPNKIIRTVLNENRNISPNKTPSIEIGDTVNDKRGNKSCIGGFLFGIVSIFLNWIILIPIVGFIISIWGVSGFNKDKESLYWMGVVGVIFNILSIFTGLYANGII
ncbi:hypothetical protein ACSVDA_24460 [Cytobacillus sp. Hm23]